MPHLIPILQKDKIVFPPVATTHPSGIIAVGGDLSIDRLKLAYSQGIFPWYEEGQPITWYAPEERMVLFLNELKISKSMRNILNRGIFSITTNKAFREVITQCQQTKRKDQDGTWITNDIIEAYCALHEKGHAISIEVWQDDHLVGGLYGVDNFPVFSGESMFSKVSNASKVAFIYLAKQLQKVGYNLLDCQVYNDHLYSLGAREISRADFTQHLSTKR